MVLLDVQDLSHGQTRAAIFSIRLVNVATSRRTRNDGWFGDGWGGAAITPRRTVGKAHSGPECSVQSLWK
jgi:hypothetical protein